MNLHYLNRGGIEHTKADYCFQTSSLINILRQLAQYLPLSNLFALLAILSVFFILEGLNRGMD